eukprot:4507248-Lingulodinium_polyedra.AAC.1
MDTSPRRRYSRSLHSDAHIPANKMLGNGTPWLYKAVAPVRRKEWVVTLRPPSPSNLQTFAKRRATRP